MFAHQSTTCLGEYIDELCKQWRSMHTELNCTLTRLTPLPTTDDRQIRQMIIIAIGINNQVHLQIHHLRQGTAPYYLSSRHWTVVGGGLVGYWLKIVDSMEEEEEDSVSIKVQLTILIREREKEDMGNLSALKLDAKLFAFSWLAISI